MKSNFAIFYAFFYALILLNFTSLVQAFDEKDIDRVKDPHERALINGDLEGADLHGITFPENIWVGTSANKVNLNSATMKGVVVLDSTLEQADLEGVNLKMSVIANSNLTGSNLKDAVLDDAMFYKVELRNTRFQNVSCKRCLFIECNFKNATLTNTTFEDGELAGTNFNGAQDFTGVNFNNTKLDDADFRKVNLDASSKVFVKKQGGRVSE